MIKQQLKFVRICIQIGEIGKKNCKRERRGKWKMKERKGKKGRAIVSSKLFRVILSTIKSER